MGSGAYRCEVPLLSCQTAWKLGLERKSSDILESLNYSHVVAIYSEGRRLLRVKSSV